MNGLPDQAQGGRIGVYQLVPANLPTAGEARRSNGPDHPGGQPLSTSAFGIDDDEGAFLVGRAS